MQTRYLKYKLSFFICSQRRMELFQEECLTLKARLDTVQQEKASDLATYKQMLDQVRKMFQDACR